MLYYGKNSGKPHVKQILDDLETSVYQMGPYK